MNSSRLDFCKKRNKDAGAFLKLSNVKCTKGLKPLRRPKGNSEKCRKLKKIKEFLTISNMLVKLKS